MVRKNKTAFRPSLNSKGTLSSILTMKLATLSQHIAMNLQKRSWRRLSQRHGITIKLTRKMTVIDINYFVSSSCDDYMGMVQCLALKLCYESFLQDNLTPEALPALTAMSEPDLCMWQSLKSYNLWIGFKYSIQLQKVGRSGSMLHGDPYQITVLIKEWHGKVSLSPSRWCSLVWALIHLPEISAIKRLKSGLEGWVLWNTLEVVDIFPVAPWAHLSTSMYPPMCT